VNPIWAIRFLMLLVVLLPSVGGAASPSSPVTPSARMWQPFGLANRIQVRGDMADPGCPSVTLLRLRPDTRLPPHSSPVDRTYLILSGTVHVGIGKKWDDAKMQTLPAGSFWLVPANTSTFEWAEDQVVCQVTATRPARDCPRLTEPAFFPPDRIEWAPFGGMERAVLAGRPGEPGCPWVDRIRFRAGGRSMPAADAASEEVTWTVLSGSLRRGSGGLGNGTAPAELPAGTVLTLAAGDDAVESDVADTVAQREFAGAGPRACRRR